MDKIYRRETQKSGTKNKKTANRVRSEYINFRVSPQEKEMIEARVAAIGVPKADFIINSYLFQNVNVVGNIKTFTAFNEAVNQIAESLSKETKLDELDIRTRESIRIILEIVNRIHSDFDKNTDS